MGIYAYPRIHLSPNHLISFILCDVTAYGHKFNDFVIVSETQKSIIILNPSQLWFDCW